MLRFDVLDALVPLLIDPDGESVEVHDGDREFTVRGDEIATLAEIGGFTFRAADLFVP